LNLVEEWKKCQNA